MPSWDPATYERYKAYRDRPALDLLLRLPADLSPREIWDLGCGTGEHAALLARRHPGARVHGLDSSPAMLDEARARNAEVDWRLGDIAGFAPDAPVDLIFTNAALQWLPDHAVLFPRLAGLLASGGVFACQIPIAYESLHHQLLREVAEEGPWAALTRTARVIQPTPSMADYHRWLGQACDEIDIWSTTYLHALEGPDPVIDWMDGTALRPYLDVLTDETLRQAFLDALKARMVEAFPPEPDGTTLFPFARLFMVARR
ncbi:trans-aconitate 2-methyltransferase [Caulobacter ginsengisoli]|uniref:Trans-aconitate 2-methyltransferase n=1 Tax=Caulobacter ginsengisoli TaxID=400775 RepID=A0ABU0IP65_9CAUL|nr:methyltransferase domain-containing protein [Caulobacter ginsengisoli]MDQ0462809.1 trans-aconitate 2-methyltransferase [Caulobacter ginsengisoli]